MITWENLTTVEGLKIASLKLVISARFNVSLNVNPAGVCCQEFAARIQNADKLVPRAIIIDEKNLKPLEILSLPNTSNPIKVDSRKNANTPSAANGAPKISPTYLE